MPAKKSKSPMTGAQRFAKYTAKMTEANQEQWTSKMKEKRVNYIARMSEQQKDAMRKRDKERKKPQEGGSQDDQEHEMYQSEAALMKAATSLQLLTAREQWTALEELQREVGITFS